MEEDDFILKPISQLKDDVSISIHPTAPSPTGWNRPNSIPDGFINYINERGGNPVSPGYACGGGCFFNRQEFIKAWENNKEEIWDDYDYLKNINKIIGWADYILQFIMQLEGYEVVQNDRLCEHWELGDRWNEFEIVTGFKDHSLIN